MSSSFRLSLLHIYPIFLLQLSSSHWPANVPVLCTSRGLGIKRQWLWSDVSNYMFSTSLPPLSFTQLAWILTDCQQKMNCLALKDFPYLQTFTKNLERATDYSLSFMTWFCNFSSIGQKCFGEPLLSGQIMLRRNNELFTDLFPTKIFILPLCRCKPSKTSQSGIF